MAARHCVLLLLAALLLAAAPAASAAPAYGDPAWHAHVRSALTLTPGAPDAASANHHAPHSYLTREGPSAAAFALSLALFVASLLLVVGSAAVRGGLLSLEEACSRYTLTVDEFLSWQMSIDQHGLAGLRTTRIQQYRQ
jgi:hypothetical protein